MKTSIDRAEPLAGRHALERRPVALLHDGLRDAGPEQFVLIETDARLGDALGEQRGKRLAVGGGERTLQRAVHRHHGVGPCRGCRRLRHRTGC